MQQDSKLHNRQSMGGFLKVYISLVLETFLFYPPEVVGYHGNVFSR